MFLLEQAFKNKDKDEVLKYIDDYFTEEEMYQKRQARKNSQEEQKKQKNKSLIDVQRQIEDLRL